MEIIVSLSVQVEDLHVGCQHCQVRLGAQRDSNGRWQCQEGSVTLKGEPIAGSIAQQYGHLWRYGE